MQPARERPATTVGDTPQALCCSRQFPQTPFQPCAAEKPNGEVCGGQHGDYPEECPLGGRGSVQVVKTAKYIKAAQHEQSAGDAVCHQGATIGNDLLRIIQLILRHGFAFAYFFENCFSAPNFFAY